MGEPEPEVAVTAEPAPAEPAPAKTTTTTTTYTVPASGAAAAPVAGGAAVAANMGRTSIPLNCPYCKAGTRTITRDEIDCCTITVFIVLLLVFWPVCWLPFVLPDCKNTKHNCANCGRLVGETPACDGCCK